MEHDWDDAYERDTRPKPTVQQELNELRARIISLEVQLAGLQQQIADMYSGPQIWPDSTPGTPYPNPFDTWPNNRDKYLD